jgi:hypothetical protein
MRIRTGKGLLLLGHGDALHVVVVDVELELILLAVEEEAEAGPVVARPQRLGQQPVALQDLRQSTVFAILALKLL